MVYDIHQDESALQNLLSLLGLVLFAHGLAQKRLEPFSRAPVPNLEEAGDDTTGASFSSPNANRRTSPHAVDF